MNWETLSTTNQLQAIIAESTDHPVMIFKHSTRCSISSMALNRLERSWNQDEVNPLKPYYLDLIANREVSNQIAADLGIEHQSPQVMIVSEGKVVYDNSHMGISYDEILKTANSLQNT